MKSAAVALTYTIDLEPGEVATLPDELARALVAGRWRLTVTPEPCDSDYLAGFAAGYGPEDEGLYDDLAVSTVASR